MIIKKIEKEIENSDLFEVFEEVDMTTPEGNTVKVLQSKGTFSKNRIENDIKNYQDITDEKQLLLDEINKL